MESPSLPSFRAELDLCGEFAFGTNSYRTEALKDGNIRSPDPLKLVQNKMNKRDIAERLVLEVSRNTNLKSYEKKMHVIAAAQS